MSEENESKRPELIQDDIVESNGISGPDPESKPEPEPESEPEETYGERKDKEYRERCAK